MKAETPTPRIHVYVDQSRRGYRERLYVLRGVGLRCHDDCLRQKMGVQEEGLEIEGEKVWVPGMPQSGWGGTAPRDRTVFVGLQKDASGCTGGIGGIRYY